MLGIMNTLNRHAINLILAMAVFIISLTTLEISWIIPPLLAGVTYYLSNEGVFFYQKVKRSKELGFTRSEYKHVEKQLKIARTELSQLMQQYVRVRSVRSFKLINDMNKLAKRIITLVQKNPHKFYAVEDFFYSHLPTAVQLTDKYTLLTKEQVPGTDIHLTLEETRKTLKDLYITMEDDLKLALSADLEHLKLEIDYAKHENEKRKERLIGGGK